MKKRKRRNYTQEFKKEAVKLITEQGYFFASDAEKPIITEFSDKLDALLNAFKKIGGFSPDIRLSYDLTMQFNALPRISLLVLFNYGDNEFPAQCSVLFQKQAEYYLDPESLAITAALLANRLALSN